MSKWIQANRDTEALLEKYETEPEHTLHVALLAGELFSGLGTLHQRGPDERELLNLAALLHDIGWSQTSTGEGHHKFSAQLIRDFSWNSLDSREVALVSQIARYHRKALPSPDHEDFTALPMPDRILVEELGGILRIADALDRKHLRVVNHVETEITPHAIVLWVKANNLWEEEREMVRKKKDLLERALRREVLV